MNIENPAEEATDPYLDPDIRALRDGDEFNPHPNRKVSRVLEQAGNCVRSNPVPVIFGALVFGAAIGYMFLSRRHVPTFRERLLADPLHSMRDALAAALAPAGHGASKIIDAAHHFKPGRAVEAASDHVRRAAGNFKFW